MKQNIPFFEVNGKRYEIKRTRYLQVETEKMKDEILLTDEQQVELAKEEDRSNKLRKLTERKNQLYDKYLETFSDEDEALYKKACVAYDNLLDEIGKGGNISGEQTNKILNIGEKLIIKALQYSDKGDIIRTENEAEEIWRSFVEENGISVAREFVVYTMNYVVGADEDENPFVAQAKARAEQRANMKKGIKEAK